MSSLEEFDRQVKALTAKGKLSGSVVESLTKLALDNLASDAHLVSTLFRYHKKASASAKLSSLYLIDALARAAKSKAKRDAAIKQKLDKGKSSATSTTPTHSPPPAPASASASVSTSTSTGTAASFLAKLEAVLGRVVVDNWDEGLREHRDKVRKVMGIWRQAGTFGEATLGRVEAKLVDELVAGEQEDDIFGARGGADDSLRVSPPPPPGGTASYSQDAAPEAAGGIPASVLALMAKSAAATAAAGAAQSDIQRAIAEARGVASRSSGPPPPPPASTYASSTPAPAPAAPAPSVALDPAQLALLQQLAAGGLGAVASSTLPLASGSAVAPPGPASSLPPPPPPPVVSRGFPGSRPFGAPPGQGQGVGVGPGPPPGFRVPPGQGQGVGGGAGIGGHAGYGTPPSGPEASAGQKRPLPLDDTSFPRPTQPPNLRPPPHASPPPPPPPTAPPPPVTPIAPFDPLAFDATSAASWASFGEMLRLTQGFVPSQEQFVAMVGMWYQGQMQGQGQGQGVGGFVPSL